MDTWVCSSLELRGIVPPTPNSHAHVSQFTDVRISAGHTSRSERLDHRPGVRAATGKEYSIAVIEADIPILTVCEFLLPLPHQHLVLAVVC